MTRAGRKVSAAVVTVLASVAMLVTLLAHYANHVLLNPAGFSDRAVALVHRGDVESLIVVQVTDRVAGRLGDDSSVQPIIQGAVRDALSDGQITAEIRASARSLQSQLVSGTADFLTLTLPDLGSSIASSVTSRSPELADELRNVGAVTVLDVPIPSSDASTLHDLATVGRDSTLLLILTIALVALALLLAPNRRRTLLGLGIGAIGAGVIAAAVYLVGGGLVSQQFSAQDASTAAQAAWSTYLRGLETWGFVLAGIGAVVACAAAVM